MTAVTYRQCIKVDTIHLTQYSYCLRFIPQINVILKLLSNVGNLQKPAPLYLRILWRYTNAVIIIIIIIIIIINAIYCGYRAQVLEIEYAYTRMLFSLRSKRLSVVCNVRALSYSGD